MFLYTVSITLYKDVIYVHTFPVGTLRNKAPLYSLSLIDTHIYLRQPLPYRFRTLGVQISGSITSEHQVVSRAFFIFDTLIHHSSFHADMRVISLNPLSVFSEGTFIIQRRDSEAPILIQYTLSKKLALSKMR